MKINYVLSDRTKSATTKTLVEVVSRAEKDMLTNFVVIVPETKSIIIEKELLALSKKGAFANIFIYSFVRLLNRLNFAKKETIISKQTAVMLIRKIVYENIDNLDCYKKTAKNINFAEKIYDTLQQFKSSEVSYEDLKLAYLQADSALKSKLKDIIFIYEKYEELLGETIFDDCDKLNLIKRFVKKSDFIKNAEIFVVGFDNITNEMISVLEELAKNAKEITFSSVYFSEKREDKYIQNNELFYKYRRVAENLKYPYVPALASSRLKGDFYVAATNLFLPTIKQAKYNGDIKIFAANNKEQEIRFVASKIIEFVNSGLKFKDIGVLSLDIVNDEKIIKRIFDEFKINYFVNQEIDISNHCLILFIKLCFELYLSHLSSDKVLKFLKSEFFREQKAYEFENFVFEYGLNYNDFLKPLKKEWKESCRDFDNFANLLCKFQDFYIKFAEKLKNAKTALEFSNVILYALEYFNVENKLKEVSEFQITCGLREESQVSSAIYAKVKEFLEMLCNFLGDMKMMPDEFLQVFLSGFSVVKLNLVPVSVDCVVVQNNTDGFYNIKNMFIVGADEDMFPMVIKDSGIILDSELEKTNILSGKKIEPTTKDINAREKFIAYESILEPSEKLYISYSVQALDGTQKKPSRIIQRLAALFGKDIFIKGFNQPKFISKISYEREFAEHISDYFSGEYLLYDINNEYLVLKGELGTYFNSYLFESLQNNPSFVIDNAKELYFSHSRTSSSQIEKYFACPYQFFANYGLRLKENKNAKLSKLDIGVLLHKVAEIFVKNINKFKGFEEEKLAEQIESYLLNIFDKLNLNKSRNQAAVKFLFEESMRLCKFLLKEQNESGFKASCNEFVFCGENSPKLVLDGGEELSLEGKIDRIDEWGDYVRIIDYKTGDIDADLFSIYYGKKIQLVSYLSAISGIKNKKIAGLFYLPIHSDYVKNISKLEEKYKMNGFLLKDIDVIKHMDNNLSFDFPKSNFVPILIKSNDDVKTRNVFELSRAGQKFLTENEFNNLKKYIEKLCRKAACEIREGYIEPSPLKKGDDEATMPCAYCELAGFCGLENARFSEGRKCQANIDIDKFKEEEI